MVSWITFSDFDMLVLLREDCNEKEVSNMRILLKILLFPITLLFSFILLICEFICLFGTALLSILAFVILVLGLAIIFFLGETQEGVKTLVLAYIISPYGVPILAAWMIGKVGQVNEWLKAI
jgi:hypothetical protein